MTFTLPGAHRQPRSACQFEKSINCVPSPAKDNVDDCATIVTTNVDMYVRDRISTNVDVHTEWSTGISWSDGRHG